VNQHPDDLAVDKFASAMKEKLAQARAKGRCGWEECAPADLSAMLYEHVAKGDPRDVANFCMFLWNLGQPITQCHKALDVAQSWEPDEETCKFLADMITADPDQITRVGFHLGYAKDDDGKLVHGFSVYEAEYPEEGVHTLVETNPTPAVAVNERLLRAAKKYFMSYCRDEASEFGVNDTGCSQEQHKDALELGEAITAAEATKGGE
jgi:hypothetical protein